MSSYCTFILMSTVRYHSYVHVYVHVHAHVMHEYLECFPFTGCTDFQIWSCVRVCVCVLNPALTCSSASQQMCRCLLTCASSGSRESSPRQVIGCCFHRGWRPTPTCACCTQLCRSVRTKNEEMWMSACTVGWFGMEVSSRCFANGWGNS